MRCLRLIPAGAALVLVTTACGGSSTPAAAPGPQLSEDASPAASMEASPPASVSPAPKPTTAASPKAGGKASPTPATSPKASPKPTPKPTPKPSPQPSPRPSPKITPAPPAGPTHGLDMTAGYRFSPMNLTIAVGDAVRAHNVDTMGHTFTGPTWDSGNVDPGQYSRVFRFNTAGTFHFVCTPHEGLGMTGTLTVR